MHCKGSEDMSSRHKCLLLWVMLLWMWLFEALCEKLRAERVSNGLIVSP